MFTGLVTDKATIQEMEHRTGLTSIKITTSYDTNTFEPGESIAVDGACLTVTEFGPNFFCVEASLETLARTSIGEKKVGDGVHLERALRASDRLGGHFVSGHVDGVATLVARHAQGDAIVLRFCLPPQLSIYMVEKGSIAIDGVSLTVNSVEADEISVAIIPWTLEKTHLGGYEVGQKANVEVDMLAKLVKRFFDASNSGPRREE